MTDTDTRFENRYLSADGTRMVEFVPFGLACYVLAQDNPSTFRHVGITNDPKVMREFYDNGLQDGLKRVPFLER